MCVFGGLFFTHRPNSIGGVIVDGLEVIVTRPNRRRAYYKLENAGKPVGRWAGAGWMGAGIGAVLGRLSRQFSIFTDRREVEMGSIGLNKNILSRAFRIKRNLCGIYL